MRILKSDDKEAQRFKKIYIETQRESLVETAKIMRGGIDSINPKIPGAFCCVGNNVEFADEIAAILAGNGNPVVVRINNGNYCAAGARGFSDVFFRAATQIEKLRNKVDVILAEPDTCPQNRYSTGAMSLHTHLTGSIIEGTKGAKHWITRLQSYEPQSGVAYRKVLSRNHKFYEKLSELVSDVKWRGCRMPLLSKPFFDFKENNGGIKEHPNAWGSCVIERLGLPMYFSSEHGGIACVEGDMVDLYTDEQIMQLLKGKVFIASDSAMKLIERGFLKYLGVSVKEWDGLQPSEEALFVNGNTVKPQVNVKCLEPTNSSVTIYSTVFHQVSGEKREELFPGVTLFKNDIGGTVCVFSGTPRARFNLIEAFSFLNYSRKLQLIKIMADLGELLAYYCGDEEMYMRCADMPDGRILCALFNLGLDPIEQVIISTANNPSSIHRLMPDGSFCELEFVSKDNVHTLNSSCNTLDPLVLVLTK